MCNQVEANLTQRITNGTTYDISFRAKWLGGSSLLNTRLYFNRAARTTHLVTPALTGTPGAQNSRYQTNIGPTFFSPNHQPIVPAANASVKVSILVQDPQGVANCQLNWSANGGSFNTVTMASAGNGLYTGTIPGRAAATIVQFYVQAVDGLGGVSTWPAAGPNSGALYKVADGDADLSRGHNFRVVLTPEKWAWLRADTNLLSNASVPGTLIYDENRTYYDVAVRLKGSMMGRAGDPRPSLRIDFQDDDPFRGEHPILMLDCSGRAGGVYNQQEEIVVHHLMQQAGIPNVQADMCWVIPPSQTDAGSGVVFRASRTSSSTRPTKTAETETCGTWS